MGDSERSDSIWQTAVEWVVREHETALDPLEKKQLITWLNVSSEHKAAYEKAQHVWLLTGLVPPKHDV